MVPTDVLLDSWLNTLAADPSTIAPAALAVRIHLAKGAFVPAPGLAVAAFTEADFQGYAALLAGLGTQQFFQLATDGTRIIQLLEPAGGWHWEVTGVLNLPQTIFGFYVTDNANVVLYGSELLAAPVVVQAINNNVDLSWIRFRVPAGAIN
jgi:hypothetical protein